MRERNSRPTSNCPASVGMPLPLMFAAQHLYLRPPALHCTAAHRPSFCPSHYKNQIFILNVHETHIHNEIYTEDSSKTLMIHCLSVAQRWTEIESVVSFSFFVLTPAAVVFLCFHSSFFAAVCFFFFILYFLPFLSLPHATQQNTAFCNSDATTAAVCCI